MIIVYSFLLGFISLFIILDFASITNFNIFNKMKIIDTIKYFYYSISLMNIKKFDDAFYIQGFLNMSNREFYIKIINVNKIIYIKSQPFTPGYELILIRKEKDEFKNTSIIITENPSLVYFYRYYKLMKLIKKTNCEKVEESDINKRINKHYISYSRDSKLKELLK